MSVTNGKQQSSEPFYRREFKQEQFLYEETSNLASEDSFLAEPFQYFILVFVGLLFAGCLGLLMLDLLLPRIRGNANEDRRRQPRNRLLHPIDQHSPVLPRRDQPRDNPFMQVPRRDPPRNDLHRRRETQPVNHLNNEVPKDPPSAFQFAFEDSTAEQELPDRPIGCQHNNTRASSNGINNS